MTTRQDYPKRFIKRLKSIKAKRPKTVIQHILKNGHITTEELQSKYGYEHPPRAARDVRELGIPLETFRVKNSEGRSIAAYRFGDPSKIRNDKLDGRKLISKQFKNTLLKENGSHCHICLEKFKNRYLQVDHRIPYEVAGDEESSERKVEDYMLLCGSCNRAKSWSCENCPNWSEGKEDEICKSCYWANPEEYKHIALREERRLDFIWQENQISVYNRLKNIANQKQMNLPDFVKSILKKHINSNNHSK